MTLDVRYDVVVVGGVAADVTAQVMASAAQGMAAATAINGDLVFEGARAAAEQARSVARRAPYDVEGPAVGDRGPSPRGRIRAGARPRTAGDDEEAS